MNPARTVRIASLATLWFLMLSVESGAQIGLKLGSAHLADMAFGWNWIALALASPWVDFGIFCYVSAFVVWMLILDKMDLSLAFPLSGMVYVVIMLVAAFGLHEALTPLHWIGVGLIVTGVCVLGRSDG
jgi:multidrug transporter EmrE-like cation transporter